MVYALDHPISLIQGNTIKQGTAKSFYDQHICNALRSSQEYGSVLTLPEFLQARCSAPFDDPLWKLPFTVQTEEIIGKTRSGNPVAIVVHGAGLLLPERIKQGVEEGLTRNKTGKFQYAVRLEDREIYSLLDGNPPCGGIEVYSYTDFCNERFTPLPRYAVVRDLDLRKEIPQREQSLSTLSVLPRYRCYAGGEENLSLYLELLGLYYKTKRAAYSHPYHDLDLDAPQGRLLQVHGIVQRFDVCPDMSAPARFLSVKRESLEEKINKEVIIKV